MKKATVLDILRRLEKTASRKEKEKILSEGAAHPDLKAVLVFALDPYKRFFVRKLGEMGPHLRKRGWESLTSAFQLLGSLSSRAITGNDARVACAALWRRLSTDDAEVFERMLLKDLRCGVNTKIANSVFPGLVPEFALQLAAGFDESKLRFPCYGEVKLDGMRVVAVLPRSGEVEWLSRGGRPVLTMEHLSAPLARLYPRGAVLDGEARTAGTFQGTMSAVKRGKPKEGAPAEFHVFDCLTLDEFAERGCKISWQERRLRLQPLQHSASPLVHVPGAMRMENMDDVRLWFNVARTAGHEGLVLKAIDGLYEFRRTRAWMKVKASETMDVEITGVQEGAGKYEGSLGALLFEHRGQTCKAGTGFSDVERKTYWSWAKSGKRLAVPLVGSLMEIEFTELTDGGRTRHARFLRLRQHDGERD